MYYYMVFLLTKPAKMSTAFFFWSTGRCALQRHCFELNPGSSGRDPVACLALALILGGDRPEPPEFIIHHLDQL